MVNLKFIKRGISVLACALILGIQPSYAEKSTVKPTQLNIPHTDLELNVDGELNETLWLQALDISLNIVNSPWNNKPSPVSTKAKIIENGEFIYVSFIAQ